MVRITAIARSCAQSALFSGIETGFSRIRGLNFSLVAHLQRPLDPDQNRLAAKLSLSGSKPKGRHFPGDQAAMIERFLIMLAFTLITLTQAAAASPDQQRGKTFALNNCARCHSIDRVTPSPLKIAPPFRTLHTRYPVETLAEALAEGIQTGHPTMPEFQLDPDQIHDLLAYMKTLE
jgi:cytochrome c